MLAAALLFSLALTPEESAAKPLPAPDARALRDAASRSVALLLAQQESLAADEDPKRAPSEWPYQGVYRVEGQIPIGYRIGGTAIVATALLAERGERIAGLERAAVLRALDFVLGALADERMGPGFERGYDVRGWGQAYALDFLLQLRAVALVPEDRSEPVDGWIRRLVTLLQESALRGHGGWNYSRPGGPRSAPATFMTAPTLQALFAAGAQGEAIDEAVVARALDSLEAGRLASGAFQYGTDPDRQSGEGFEAVEGAIGRMPVCEATLLLAGRGSIERVRASLAAFFEHWQHLEDRRKRTGTHEPPFMIAPYYFFYAHRYAAQAIEMLPASERPPLRERLYALLWKVREENGAWNDRVFPRSANFGTAMTMLALREPEQPPPAGWPPQATKGR